MANFCTKCGKPLQDGEICSCQSYASNNIAQNQVNNNYNPGVPNQTVQVNQTAPVFNAEKGKAVFNDVKVNFLDLLKKPADAARNFVVKGDIVLAMILIALQALISSIFAIIMSVKTNSEVFDKIMEDADDINDELAEKIEDMFKISVAGNFFRTLIFSILLSLILACIIFVILKIFGMNLNIKNVICIAATKCVPIIVLDILACLICLFAEDFGIGLFLISGLVGLVYVICTFNLVVAVDENKKLFIIAASVLAFSIVLAVFASCTYKTYFSEDLGEVVDETKDEIFGEKMIDKMLENIDISDYR